MGSHYSGVSVMEASSNEEALRKAREVIEHSLWEDGHSAYSGGYGTCGDAVLIPTPMTEEDADRYIGENHCKWEPMMVIKASDQEDTYYYGGWCAC